MSEEPDVGEAVEYILAERPRFEEDHVWRVLMELGSPPPKSAEQAALHLIGVTHPDVPRRQVRVMLREWRNYAGLATEGDWSTDDE